MFENNLLIVVIILLFIGYCAVSFLQKMHETALKSFKELLTAKEHECLRLEQNFKSLLSDKKQEAIRRKEAERMMRLATLELEELENVTKEQMKVDTNLLSPLNRCRQLLHFIGKVGMFDRDFFRRYNTGAYERFIGCYANAVNQTILTSGNILNGRKYDEEKIKEAANNITAIANTLAKNTGIIQALLDELYLMADNFFKGRETYLLSGGPEPFAQLDIDITSGKMLEPFIKDIVNKYNFDKTTNAIIVSHMVKILIYPLLDMRQKLNHNLLEEDLYSTGYTVNEIKDASIGLDCVFIIPSFSRLSLERKMKIDTSKYFN